MNERNDSMRSCTLQFHYSLVLKITATVLWKWVEIVRLRCEHIVRMTHIRHTIWYEKWLAARYCFVCKFHVYKSIVTDKSAHSIRDNKIACFSLLRNVKPIYIQMYPLLLERRKDNYEHKVQSHTLHDAVRGGGKLWNNIAKSLMNKTCNKWIN